MAEQQGCLVGCEAYRVNDVLDSDNDLHQILIYNTPNKDKQLHIVKPASRHNGSKPSSSTREDLTTLVPVALPRTGLAISYSPVLSVYVTCRPRMDSSRHTDIVFVCVCVCVCVCVRIYLCLHYKCSKSEYVVSGWVCSCTRPSIFLIRHPFVSSSNICCPPCSSDRSS